VRLNRARVEKCSQAVKPDDVLTIALRGGVRVVKVLGEAERRGPAQLAQTLYQDLAATEKQDAEAAAS
jgi:ribosome-associated heat shock protein Hsp15